MYLLDTHVLLWWLSDTTKLSTEHIQLLSDSRTSIYLSAVTAWEITIKTWLGKLELPKNFWQVVEKQGYIELPITTTHARSIEFLPSIHHDPFDRLLIAQALSENMTLLTQDKMIHQYKVRCL